MGMTPAEVTAAMLEYAEKEFEYGSFSAYTDMFDNIGRSFDIPNLGVALIVACKDYDSNKSYEGWHEDIWIVFDIEGTLYRIKGSHTSYTGTEWEDTMTIVKPQTKQIIEFVDIEKDKDDTDTI